MVSTDEVYGSPGEEGHFAEPTPLAPNSPYSASKAGADLLCWAYQHTFPEKLIPLIIIKALAGQELPVYGDGMNERDWIHVEDHCAAMLAAAERGWAGEVYNVGARNEWPNIEIVKTILKLVNRPESLIRYVQDRPGHDRRYAIDPSKAQRELGWAPTANFGEGLKQTVQWYLEHEPW
jgi:dTDP-glucose 4,6-dehydratase